MSGGKVFARLSRRIGRRGTSLLFFFVLDYTIAWSLLLISEDPQLIQQRYAGVLIIMPFQKWAWCWFAVGTVCLVSAFFRNDRIAFSLAVLIKIAWGLGFMVSWIFYHSQRGWFGAVIYLSFAGFVWLISGWHEPAIRD